MSLHDRLYAIFGGANSERLFAVPASDLLLFQPATHAPDDDHWEITSPLAMHALNELAGSGLAAETETGYRIQWDTLYAALADPDRISIFTNLGIPKIGDLRPRLRSANSLDDSEFEIVIDGWVSGTKRINAIKLGAVVNVGGALQLLPYASFELAKGIAEFWKQDTRTAESNRYHWGHIRKLAVRANASLDNFLADTIVLTPDKLQIKLMSADIAGSSVVEVQPWFSGAPDTWLAHFDRASKVRNRYQIASEKGLVEVLISPQVKSVLETIKAMPGRRTAGAFAERFLHNPFATLGPDAVEVLDEAQFDEARHEAGIDFERFAARIDMRGGEISEVGIAVERLEAQFGNTTYEKFHTAADLKAFIARVESKIQTGCQLCEWRGHRLDLTGETQNEMELLKTAFVEWTKARVAIKSVDVHDLKRYSERVSGIGVQERIVSPYIPVQSGEDPWFPEPPLNTDSNVSVTVPIDAERTLEIVVDSKVYDTIRRTTTEAEVAGRESIDVPGYPNVIPIATAKAILEELNPRFGKEFQEETAPYKAEPTDKGAVQSKQRKELLLRANIAQPDFAEQRSRELQLATDAAPQLPACLRKTVTLKDHQALGIAWLQNLFEKSPNQCRGAVLADDMGLGKTLQLLALICRAIEAQPSLDPVLVVAPVSLLENWKEEIEKFFAPTPRILTLYGRALDSLRAPRSIIDTALIEQGIARFLKPDWMGDAQIVLTTYETLRDFEFSIAAIRWSIMVCDEAQKIKNPAAMVTRSAKKQNVRFPYCLHRHSCRELFG